MKSRFTSAVLLTAIALFTAGCQEDPEEAANKLFVESTQSIAEAESITSETGPELEKKAALLQVAVQKLNQIVSEYPAATLAVEIASTGGAKGVEVVELQDQITAIQQKVKCLNEPSNRSCVLLGDLDGFISDEKLSEIEQLSPFFAAMNNFAAVEKSIAAVQAKQDFDLNAVVPIYLFAAAYENTQMMEKLKSLGNNDRFLSVIRTIDGSVKVRKLEAAGKYAEASEALLAMMRSNEANMMMGRADFGRVFEIANAARASGKVEEAVKIADASVTAINDGWLRAGPTDVLVLLQIYGAAGKDDEKAAAYELLQISQMLGCAQQDMVGLNAVENQLALALVAKEANDKQSLDSINRCIQSWYDRQLENNYVDSFLPQIDSYTKILVALGDSERAKVQLSEIMTDLSAKVVFYSDSVALALLAVGDQDRAKELLIAARQRFEATSIEDFVNAILELRSAGVDIGPELTAFLDSPEASERQLQVAFEHLIDGELDQASDGFAAALYGMDVSQTDAGMSEIDRMSRKMGRGIEAYLGMLGN